MKPTGIILIILVALLLFGPKRLPDLGKAIGKTMREFKNAAGGLFGDDDAKATVSAPAQPAQQQPIEVKVITAEGTAAHVNPTPQVAPAPQPLEIKVTTADGLQVKSNDNK